MIEIKPYSEAEHYPLLSTWWAEHGWPAVPPHKLPPFGFVALADGVPTFASFAYMDNGGTGVAMMEWSVGNPSAEPKTLIKALKALVGFMLHQLKELDYDFIFTSCKQVGLARLYEKCGFTRTDSSMIHLVHITAGTD